MTSGDDDQLDGEPQLDPGTLGVDDAYDLETPEDNRRLYQQWASTYDSEFVQRHRYIYHNEVIAALAGHATISDLDPILDVGCGTGVAGDALRALGARSIDGLDISPEMLGEADQRRDSEDQKVYRALAEADLTKPLDIESAVYAAVVSVGTFTHGHVGPEALEELIRIVRPGGVLCLGVNEQFYETTGFETIVQGHKDNGRLQHWSVSSARIYENPPDGHESATALALTIVVAG